MNQQLDSRVPGKRRIINQPLFLILLGSFILKGVLVFATQVPSPDGVLYLNAAREFSQGHFHQGMQIFPMPFYPLMISLLHTIIPDWLRAGQAISWISLVMVTLPLYHITKTLFNREAALWSSLIYTLTPRFNSYASQVIRGPLGLFMLTMAVLFVLKSLQEERVRNFFLISLFFLPAFLSRAEIFLFLPFLVFFYLGIIICNHRQAFFISKGVVILLALPVTAGIIFWFLNGKSFAHAIRLAELQDYFQMLAKKDFLINYHHIYQELKTLSKSLPNPYYTGNFAETARHYIWFTYIIALMETLIVLIFPTNVILATYKFRSARYNRKHFFVIGIILLFTGSSYFFLISHNFIQKRYLMMPAFFLFPWIGNGASQLYNKVKKSNHRKLATGLFILLFLIAPTVKTLSYARENNISLKEAGIWLRNKNVVKKDIVLICNDKRVPFFADLDRNFMLISFDNLPQAESYARAHKSRYISLVISQKRKAYLPAFHDYKIIQTFHDQKNIVIIASDKIDTFPVQ